MVNAKETVPPDVMDQITSDGVNYKIFSYFMNNPDMMTPEITSLMVDALRPGKYVEASTIVKLTPYLTMDNIHKIGEHIISTDVSNQAYDFLEALDENYKNTIPSMNEGLLRELLKNDLPLVESKSIDLYGEVTPLFHIIGIEKLVLEYLIMHGVIERFVDSVNSKSSNEHKDHPDILPMFKGRERNRNPLTVDELLNYYNVSKHVQLGVLI